MRFQGENCSLSFALYVNSGEITVSGTLWPRRLAARSSRDFLRFSALFSENEMLDLQRWLSTDSAHPFQLPNSTGRVIRLRQEDSDSVRFAIEFSKQQIPDWWVGEAVFPLRIYLDMHPNEFVYLTGSLSQEHWSIAAR